jgi:rubrerythrin
VSEELKATRTHANLKAAFAAESEANRRCLYFARVADVEGHPEIAGLFRDTGDSTTGHGYRRVVRDSRARREVERRQSPEGPRRLVF